MKLAAIRSITVGSVVVIVGGDNVAAVEAERLWNVFTAGLMDALGALRDMETINLSPLSARHLDDPFIVTVGFDAGRQELRCYEAGPVSEPQAVDLSPAQDEMLRSLGWTAPHAAADHAEQHTYWCSHPYVNQDARERGHAAAMLVATLRQVHGCRTLADVEVERGIAGAAVEDALASLRELLEIANTRGA